MKETNLIQSMTNIKKIRLFNNSLLYGNPKVYLDFSRIDFFCFNDTLFLFIPENLCIIKTEYKNKTDLLEDIVNGITPKDIEKCFDDLKNETDMKRLRTQSDETARGKLFVAFIAQIVRAYSLTT